VVSSEPRAGVLILSLSGELDLAASALLERELESAEAARPTRDGMPLVKSRCTEAVTGVWGDE
jgi:hypothetical protein